MHITLTGTIKAFQFNMLDSSHSILRRGWVPLRRSSSSWKNKDKLHFYEHIYTSQWSKSLLCVSTFSMYEFWLTQSWNISQLTLVSLLVAAISQNPTPKMTFRGNQHRFLVSEHALWRYSSSPLLLVLFAHTNHTPCSHPHRRPLKFPRVHAPPTHFSEEQEGVAVVPCPLHMADKSRHKSDLWAAARLHVAHLQLLRAQPSAANTLEGYGCRSRETLFTDTTSCKIAIYGNVYWPFPILSRYCGCPAGSWSSNRRGKMGALASR